VSPSSGPVPTGHTTVAAVIGDPVRHSRSPAIHNAAFAAVGLDWVFVALPTVRGRGADAVAAMATLELGGMSVTMPLKEEVAHALERLSPLAARLDAVNCVAWQDGGLVGHNTDASGFAAAVAHAGTSLEGATVAVIGAGGAARAAIVGALDAGASGVRIVNRTLGRSEAAAALDPDRCRVGSFDDVAAAEVVVNATPVGMTGTPGIPVDPGMISAGQVVVDLVYDPVDTALLTSARSSGATVIDGLGMLVHQAADAFRLWTGQEPPVEVMLAAAAAAD
jgi:shikimate dehydrogenase